MINTEETYNKIQRINSNLFFKFQIVFIKHIVSKISFIMFWELVKFSVNCISVIIYINNDSFRTIKLVNILFLNSGKDNEAIR